MKTFIKMNIIKGLFNEAVKIYENNKHYLFTTVTIVVFCLLPTLMEASESIFSCGQAIL